MIAGAPVAFSICIIVGVMIAFAVMRWHYRGRLETTAATVDFLTTQVEEYRSKLHGASPDQAATEIASLRDRLNEVAAWRNAQISERHLTPPQRAKLIELLRVVVRPTPSILEIAAIIDPEAQQYAIEILEAFNEAEVRVQDHYGQMAVEPSTVLSSSPKEIGLAIGAVDVATPGPLAAALMTAFTGAGIDISYSVLRQPPFRPEWHTAIMVFRKPPS